MWVYGTAPASGGSTDDGHQPGDAHAIEAGGTAACGLRGLVPLHDPPERWMTEPSIAQCPVCVASLKAGADIDAGPDTPTNSPR
jgi:hypothetical protein